MGGGKETLGTLISQRPKEEKSGEMATNEATVVETISLTRLYNGLSTRYTAFDSRPVTDFDKGRIRNSKSIHSRDSAILPFRKLVLVTADGTLSDSDRTWVKDHGAAVLEGGYAAWSAKYAFLCSGRDFFGRFASAPFGLPSEIIEGFMFLGGSICAEERVTSFLGIKLVVNLLDPEIPISANVSRSVEVIRFPIADCSGADIQGAFEGAFPVLQAAEKESKKTLVHCLQGISRSATVVIAYLMRTRSWTAAVALEFVRDSRQQVRPNRGFAEFLVKFEKSLGLSSTPTIDVRDF